MITKPDIYPKEFAVKAKVAAKVVTQCQGCGHKNCALG